MGSELLERVLWLLKRNPQVKTVDLTGGAPELHPEFRDFVESVRSLGRHVMDRCNLTILFEPGFDDLPEFFAAHQVEVIASLPCYTAENVDQQRGRRVFDRSVRALQRLNAVGYGQSDSGLDLQLVYNPVGAFLPHAQAELESKYREELYRLFGIQFNQLFTITNMPITRYADALRRHGEYDAYLQTLVDSFNPATLSELMCRSLVSVGYDGTLFDCDFNQALKLPVPSLHRSIYEIEDLGKLSSAAIQTGDHCFGCTAGSGSSCGGSIT